MAIERWGVHDHLSFMQQLGALTAKQAACVTFAVLGPG